MSRIPSFTGGALVGALATYYLDPRRGRLRRAHVVDFLTHARRLEGRLVDKATADATNRVRGLVERARSAPSGEVGDEVLDARVRAALGTVVSHPSALEIAVRGGQVTLGGAILAAEADNALRRVNQVKGIRGVIDRLDRHRAADVPALQGGGVRVRGELWPPSLQAGAILGGTVLAGWGLFRRGWVGSLAAIAGPVLALRGGLNMSLPRMLRYVGGREGIGVQKTITVNAPVRRVFDLFRHFENFPQFMQHVQSVDIDPNDSMRSRWKVDGPARSSVSYDVTVTHVEEPREIAWRTLPDQPIEHTGVVRFDPVTGGTRIQIRMTYRPPGGVFGHAIAHILGFDPKSRLDDDMIRVKALLEAGRTRAHGAKVELADILH